MAGALLLLSSLGFVVLLRPYFHSLGKPWSLMTAKKSHIHVNMSNSPAYTGAQSPLLVGQALEDISQRDNIETEMLQKEQETLSALQVTLSDVQKNSDEAEKKLKCKVRDLLIMEDDMIHLEQKMQAGRDCCASITAEKTKLLEQIIEEEEKACMARAQFDIYQRKMQGHRQAVLNVVGQTDICMQEKRALVQELRNAKEELKEDLKNPKGNRVQTAKREIDTLKREIGVMRENIAQRREDQQKVLETHAQIKKEIESQNKRFEAISKHLHCQIIKAQAVHRQMSRDIYHMERQKAELQRQLESSNYSAQC